MRIELIVSGGQTGADRGGLDAALYCGIPHGGWCPKGRKAEDGLIPAKYLLRELETANDLDRAEANVVDSDATVIFTEQGIAGGSLRTLEFCREHAKPWHHVALANSRRETAVKEIVAWLAGDPAFNDYEFYDTRPPASGILNVTGSRESKAPGIADAVKRIIVAVLIAVNPACREFYPLSKPDRLGSPHG